MVRNRRWTIAVSAAVALGLIAAGCGDDDDADDTTTTEAEAAGDDIDPEFADYCALAIELDEQPNFASSEQLEEIRDLAPDEIADEINLVVDKFLAAGDDPGAVFDDPEVGAAFEPIEAFEAEHCGIEQDDETDDQDPSVTVLDPEAARVDVTATDYAFAFDPESPSAGKTSFVMVNEGAERHLMLLYQVEEGSTFDEVLEAQGDEGVAQEFESATAANGEEAVLTVDLVAGEYGMICYLPNAEGKPHVALGMSKAFTVS